MVKGPRKPRNQAQAISDAQEPLSASNPWNGIKSGTVVSARNDVVEARPIPPSVLEALWRLPLDGGVQELFQGLVDVLVQSEPQLRVGVVHTPTKNPSTDEGSPEGASGAFVASGSAVMVVSSGLDGALGMGPIGRIFPSQLVEHRLPIATTLGRTHLHLAGDGLASPWLDDAPGGWQSVLQGLLSQTLRQWELQASLLRSQNELQSLEDAMRHANRLAHVGRSTAAVAHDMNNPLTAIDAYAERLCADFEKPGAVLRPEDVEKVHRIREASGRLRGLVRSLVTYARPQGQLRSPCVVSDLVADALRYCEHEVAAAKATVHQQNKGEARVLAVADHLVQVFVNLVTNACHALPADGGTITLESECVHEGTGGECVRISVRDSGAGVPEGMRSKIFTPFFTTKGDDRGSGLGLYVVRTVIEEHGGTVVLDGGVGGGACFVVTLPLENSTLRSLG